MRALVIEDDAATRRLLESALQERGHDVTAVADAEAALELHGTERFPLMVVDWHLTGLDGLELCRRVRRAPGGEDVVLLVVTGANRVEDLLEALDAGASDYLAKPISVPLLRTRLLIAERMVEGIARRKEMQARLVTSDRLAAVGTLAAGVAHEINNPLACIVANLDVLREELDDSGIDEARRRELLAMLADTRLGADRIRRVVRELRVFASDDDGVAVPVDLRNSAERAIQMAWNEIRHRARLVRDLAPVPPVLASEGKLAQVALDLVVNAAHAIREGAAEENEIRVATRTDENGRAVLEVQDTGAGIPPELLGRIFDPFFTTKPQGSGRGLGLSVSHGIVTALGGEIVVQSAPGRGARFVVTLPPAAERAAREETPAPAVRGRVLVIDDEPMVTAVVRRALRGAHEVTTALRAREALERLTSGERFDAILCDVMMPELTAMDFYRALGDVAPEQRARLVFMTGGTFTAAAREFLATVPNPRLPKPFDIDRLRALVADLVNSRAAP